MEIVETITLVRKEMKQVTLKEASIGATRLARSSSDGGAGSQLMGTGADGGAPARLRISNQVTLPFDGGRVHLPPAPPSGYPPASHPPVSQPPPPADTPGNPPLAELLARRAFRPPKGRFGSGERHN
jgi:hypothetical protein